MRIMAPPPLIPPSPSPSPPSAADAPGGAVGHGPTADWYELPAAARPHQPQLDHATRVVVEAQNMAVEATHETRAAGDSPPTAAAEAIISPLLDPNAAINVCIDPRAIIGADAKGYGSHLMCGVMGAFGHGNKSLSMSLAADAMQNLRTRLREGSFSDVGITRIEVIHAAVCNRDALALLHDQAYGVGAAPLDYRTIWDNDCQPSPGESDDLLFVRFDARCRALAHALRRAGGVVPIPVPVDPAARVEPAEAPTAGLNRNIGGSTIQWAQLSGDRLAAIGLTTVAGLADRVALCSSEAATMAETGMPRALVVRWLDNTISAFEQEARNVLQLSPTRADPARPYGNVLDANVSANVPAAAETGVAARRAPAAAPTAAPAFAPASSAVMRSPWASGGVAATETESPPWAAQEQRAQPPHQAAPLWAPQPRSTRTSPTATARAPTAHLTPTRTSYPARPPSPYFFPTRADGTEIRDVSSLAGGDHLVPQLEGYLADITGRQPAAYASGADIADGT